MGHVSALPLITIVVIIIVVITVVLITLLRLLTSQSTAVNEFAAANQGVVGSPISLNIPIYVVGPTTLTQKLVSIGISQSLIRPVSLDELPNLPNGSVVVVDWPLIKPSIVASDPLGNVAINLTSPVIRDLAVAIARNDIVGIYANGSDEGIVEFVLAYSWVIATNHRLLFDGKPTNDYLLAYPIIPVNPHEPVIIIAKRTKAGGLIIGPVYLNQLTTVIEHMMKPTTTSNTDPIDPCYEAYYNYGVINHYFNSNPEPGVYVANSFTFLWATPMLTNTEYPTGILGYQDGNGTYLWDTCLLIGNTVAYLANNPSGVLYYLPTTVVGYEEYQESSTMYNNGGYEEYQVGAIDYYTSDAWYNESYINALVADPVGATFNPNSWNSPLTSSITSYEITLGLAGLIPTFSVSIKLPVSESISASTNPWNEIELLPGAKVLVPNITWTFNIGATGSDVNFLNAFEDITPAMTVLSSLSTTSTAAFPIDFENYAITKTGLCYYDHEIIWINAEWYIVIVPQSSSTVSLTQSSLTIIPGNAPSGSYVSGVSSGVHSIECGR